MMQMQSILREENERWDKYFHVFVSFPPFAVDIGSA